MKPKNVEQITFIGIYVNWRDQFVSTNMCFKVNVTPKTVRFHNLNEIAQCNLHETVGKLILKLILVWYVCI